MWLIVVLQAEAIKYVCIPMTVSIRYVTRLALPRHVLSGFVRPGNKRKKAWATFPLRGTYCKIIPWFTVTKKANAYHYYSDFCCIYIWAYLLLLHFLFLIVQVLWSCVGLWSKKWCCWFDSLSLEIKVLFLCSICSIISDKSTHQLWI